MPAAPTTAERTMSADGKYFLIDGEIGNKKSYDPRGYLKKAEENMAARVCVACDDLLSSGKSLFGSI